MVLSEMVTGMYVSVGEFLRQLRRQKNFTQTELGGKQYSKSYVSGVERGEIVPTHEALHFFAQQLDQPPEIFDTLLQQARTIIERSASSIKPLLPVTSTEEEKRPELAALLKLVLAAKNPYTFSFAHAFAASFNEPSKPLPQAQDALYACLQGLLAQEQGDFQQARTNFEYALALTPAQYQPVVLGALGTNYFLDQHYQTALECHLRALYVLNKHAASENTARLLLTIELHCGDDCRALGRHHDACSHYERARQHLRASHNMQAAAQLYLGLGYCTYAVLYQDRFLVEALPDSPRSDNWESAFQCALDFLLQSTTLYHVSNDMTGEAHARLVEAMILLDFSSWHFHHAQEHDSLTAALLLPNTALLLKQAEEHCHQVLTICQQSSLAETAPTLMSETLATSFEYTAHSYLIRIHRQRATYARLGDDTANALYERSLAISLCQRVLDANAERVPLTGLSDDENSPSIDTTGPHPPTLPDLSIFSPTKNDAVFPDPISLSEIYLAVGEVTEECGRVAATSADALKNYTLADQYFQSTVAMTRQALPGIQPLHDASSCIRRYQRYTQTLKERITTNPEMKDAVMPLLFSLLTEIFHLLPSFF